QEVPVSARKDERRILVIAAVLASLWGGVAAGAVSIIPAPVSCEQREGAFVITSATRVVAEGDAAGEAAGLVDSLAPATGFRLERGDAASSGSNAINLRIDPAAKDQLGEEGYALNVTAASIELRAAESAGLFYGVQTLRQLLPAAIFGSEKAGGVEWTVPCVRIGDYPRFGWRGLLIDPARHFIPVPDFERFIDAMALHKFNRLQAHFTDDQGWRLEIRKYPRLVEIGSKMDFTTILKPLESRGDEASRAGWFYTQDQIRHLVRYAADRYITIVPEIEMPAHTGAAIVSYPQLGLYPEKLAALPVDQRWTAHEGVLAPRPATVAFMQDVLAEVIELFPSREIHIGGDEANIDHWRQCPEMKTLMAELGLKNVEELHSWFIRQMDSFLTSHGRQLIGWDEILQGGLAPGAIVMSWRGEQGGITAAQAGHDVVMAPTSHTYFDYYQGPPASEPKAIGGDVPLAKVYAYEPVPAALTAEQAKHVLGGQAQLWGEYISTASHRQYMTYPRAAALAEVLWSRPQDRNYDGFLARLTEHLKRLKALGVNYRPLDAKPAP
ncbi:MAG: beta-N-acetylhexosaminidase, partial [Phycisphaerales bacterium]